MTILNKEKILEVARAFIEEGKYDRAIREYEKLVLADPTDLRVKLRIAELYTKRKQIVDAIRIYREVAESYAAEGFYLKAVTVYKNVLRLNPSLNEINEQLAILYEKMGLLADAIRQYDILASSLDLRGQVDRVLEIRNRIVRLAPKDGSARIKLAEIYQREGKMEDAIDQYEEYARQLEESGGDRAKLADLFEKILAYRPEKHEMLRKLIHIYNTLGDNKKALRCLEVGKDLVERDPALLAMMARIYASQNQNETARTKYVTLADLQAERGNVDAALDAYVEILVLLPDEEDRLARRVEEMRSGALEEIAMRAQRRREELEQEEIRRQEAEVAREAKQGAEKGGQGEVAPAVAAQKPAPAGPAEAGRDAAQETQTEDASVSRAQRVKPVPPAPEERAVSQGPASAPVSAPAAIPAVVQQPRQPAPAPAAQGKPAAPDRKAGDAAFDLADVYLRMGLPDEAHAEFARAKEVYLACLGSGMKDADLPKRIARIESALSGAPSGKPDEGGRAFEPEAQASEDVARRDGPMPAPVAAVPAPATSAGSPAAPAEKKKKVSFV